MYYIQNAFTGRQWTTDSKSEARMYAFLNKSFADTAYNIYRANDSSTCLSEYEI